MYNGDLKTDFVHAYTTSRSTMNRLRLLFRATEPYERSLSRDLSAFTVDDLERFLDTYGYALTTEKTSVPLQLIRAYSAWCVRRGVEGATDAAFHVIIDREAHIRRYMVSSPGHLASVMNSLFYPLAEQSTDILMMGFFWLSFSGLLEDDIMEVMTCDLDFERMTVTCRGVEYPIYPESSEALRACTQLTQLKIIKTKTDFRRPHQYFRQRVESPHLLRGTMGPPVKAKFRVAVRKCYNRPGQSQDVPVLSAVRLWQSGFFYRTYMAEKAGIAPSFDTVSLSEDLRHLMEVVDKRVMNVSLKKRLDGYSAEYEAWKSAFYNS